MAEIDGVVTRRNVNPGNNVQAGQQLMAVRSLDRDLDRRQLQGDATRATSASVSGWRCSRTCTEAGGMFRGRITGFTYGTGSDAGPPPAPERDGELRQGRPAAPGPDRAGGLRPGRRHALRRAVGDAVRVLQGSPDGSERRPPAPGLWLDPGTPVGGASREYAPPRSANPWLIAVAVVVPTFMEVLDTTIANVALRYIAGGLSAAEIDSEWVITSYLAANAIVLPMSGWLSIRLGRRNYFLLSVARLHAQLAAVRPGDQPGSS